MCVHVSVVGCRKGDYYRYLAEFKSGEERKEAADHSMKAYQVCLYFRPLASIVVKILKCLDL